MTWNLKSGRRLTSPRNCSVPQLCCVDGIAAWTDVCNEIQHREQIDPVHAHAADGGILGDLKKDLSHFVRPWCWIYSRFLSYFLQLKTSFGAPGWPYRVYFWHFPLNFRFCHSGKTSVTAFESFEIRPSCPSRQAGLAGRALFSHLRRSAVYFLHSS
jgi:hypothetical protein